MFHDTGANSAQRISKVQYTVKDTTTDTISTPEEDGTVTTITAPDSLDFNDRIDRLVRSLLFVVGYSNRLRGSSYKGLDIPKGKVHQCIGDLPAIYGPKITIAIYSFLRQDRATGPRQFCRPSAVTPC